MRLILGALDLLDQTPNVVDVSISRLEEVFEASAVPGFTGSVLAELRLLPTAGHEVDFVFRRRQIEQVNATQKEHALSSNHRVSLVRLKIAELRPRLRIYLPVVSLTGHYHDGELRSFEVVDTGFGKPATR